MRAARARGRARPGHRGGGMNGLREALPLLHGLGANSPYWFGMRLRHGQRPGGGRSGPTRGAGVPPFLRSWDDYLEALEAVRAGGGPTDHTMVWWDARPQPRLGTVELREIDVQSEPGRGRRDRGAGAGARASGPPRHRSAVQRRSRRSTGRASGPLATASTPRSITRGAPCRCARWRGSSSTSWTATTRSRASSGSSPAAPAPTGSAPRTGAAACRTAAVLVEATR